MAKHTHKWAARDGMTVCAGCNAWAPTPSEQKLHVIKAARMAAEQGVSPTEAASWYASNPVLSELARRVALKARAE